MFLLRTARSARGTAHASAALAHLREMRNAGHRVTVTNLAGRHLSDADLRREADATRPLARH